MPGDTYLDPYRHFRLNEVVIPGAHDAGVYTNVGASVQTQKHDIAGQASAGCRFFDLRIGAVKQKIDGHKVYTPKAYHLDGALVIKHKLKNNEQGLKSYQNVSHAGGWGGGLDEILKDAYAFVKAHPTEFLILKFAKCYNWEVVAERCVSLLDDLHFTRSGNMNRMRVGDLAGHVITVFEDTPSVQQALAPVINVFGDMPHGIKFIRPLYDSSTGQSKPYLRDYDGMQYFGKFSSTNNIDKNTRKQSEMFKAGASTDIDALGMMYWTTTDFKGSIRDRNSQMWVGGNQALKDTWNSGLEDAIEFRFGNELNSLLTLASSVGGGFLGGRAKAFMPNIVMMDFVSRRKCDIVDELNGIAAQTLQKLMVRPMHPKGVQQVV